MKISVLVLIASALLLSCSNAFLTPNNNGVIVRRHHDVDLKTIQPNSQPFLPRNNNGQSTARNSLVLAALPPSAILAATDAAAASSSTPMNPLLAYFLETLIANGVPAFFTLIVIGFGAFMLGKSRKDSDSDNMLQTDNPAAALYDDLYGSSKQSNKKKFPFFGGGGDDSDYGGPGSRTKLPKNSGIPKDQYLTVTHLNSKMDAYDYSVKAATQSKAAAAASFRKATFTKALQRALGPLNLEELPASTLQALQTAEAKFLKLGRVLVSELQHKQVRRTQRVIDEEMRKMGVTSAYDFVDPSEVSSTQTNSSSKDAVVIDAETVEEEETKSVNSVIPASNATSASTSLSNETDTKPKTNNKKTKGNLKALTGALPNSELATALQELEVGFIRDVIRAVGPERAPALRAALMGDIAARGTGGLLLLMLEERPLTALLSGNDKNNHNSQPSRVFMTHFPGDATASQVANLREEVTAIVRSAQPGDEALVVLQTGGGTVTGYGLAAAQLMRFKEAGMKLTICVEQVAASGGYMMACVADRIVASPFAVLGSIGVISDIPNVYDRLKKEGIEFQTVTAGKYKRTLTPTKKVTKEDFEKTKEDVEDILVLFRDYVAQNRPQLDIDKVATGETWFGTAALERNLCDEIKTVDGVLMDYMNANQDVYEVKYTPPVKSAFSGLVAASTEQQQQEGGSILQRGIRWLARTLIREVKAAVAAESSNLNLDQPVQERYRAEDDTSKRMRAQD